MQPISKVYKPLFSPHLYISDLRETKTFANDKIDSWKYGQTFLDGSELSTTPASLLYPSTTKMKCYITRIYDYTVEKKI